MPGRLQGKIAVVTGSNSGIGRGIALAYGREGAIVICANRQAESKYDADKHATTNDLIVQEGGEAVFLPLTFTESTSVNELVKKVAEKYGRIDVWFNVAGYDDQFDAAVDTNLKGMFKCIRAASAQMITQTPAKDGIRGRIINIGSVFGVRGWPESAAYSASRQGITGLVRAAAIDLSPYKVLINIVAPGMVLTEASAKVPSPWKEVLTQKTLLDFGHPSDVAGIAVFLASGESSWIQGQELLVDGGFTIT